MVFLGLAIGQILMVAVVILVTHCFIAELKTMNVVDKATE